MFVPFSDKNLISVFRQAEACNTTPYCIHCIWNTVIIPKDDEVKCNLCKDEIIEGGVHKVKTNLLSSFVEPCY